MTESKKKKKNVFFLKSLITILFCIIFNIRLWVKYSATQNGTSSHFLISMCNVMSPEQFAYGEVGAPVPCCEIKLVDVPEANYFSKNTPKPQGEVWVRGPSITQGYWKQDQITKETITEDNWLQTGDIAEWNENGTLTIIDRKKNLVKLSNGEYIALEKLESIYKSCVHITNICVFADSLFCKPVAVAVVTEPVIRKLASSDSSIPDNADFEVLCKNENIRKQVLKSLLSTAKEGGLKGSELLFDVHLCHEEWTTESVSLYYLILEKK